MTETENYRHYFPHLSRQIYLNHAAISPVNSRARQAVEEFLSLRMETNIEFWPEALEQKQRLKELIGKLIHASPENIALAPNTSAGLNILALGLDWKPGDRILLNNFEFPANVIPFLNLQQRGVEVDFVSHRDGRLEPEDFEAKIHPCTRLLSISFVEFLNGFRNDLSRFSRLCRERNIIFAVDAIQGVGALQMDVEKMGIDFLAAGGHKWLMWPAGTGFAYISPRIFEQLHPAQAGWLSLQTPWNFFDYRQPFAPDAGRFEPGSFNTMGIVAATASLKMMLEIGPAAIEKRVLENTDYLIGKLQQAGYRLFTDVRLPHRSGIVSFFHPRAEELFHFLKNNRITVSLREGAIRVSPHFYNNRQDLDQFLDAVKRFG